MCCASATQISDCTMIWTVHFSLTLFGAGGKQSVGGAGRMAGGSGTGQSHPAAGTARLCGDKMPPAYWQEWLPRENIPSHLISMGTVTLKAEPQVKYNHMLPLHHFLSPGKSIHHKVSPPSTQHSLLLLHLLSFLVSTHSTSHGCTATQMGAHTWAPQHTRVCGLQVPVPVVSGDWKVGNGTDSIPLEKFLRCSVLPASPLWPCCCVCSCPTELRAW